MKQILIALFIGCSLSATAQTGAYNEHAEAYIRQYKEMAMAEQRRSGVPAAITLAQGIYETQAGQSELATEANNHFGIKCKKEWTGQTFAHTDDAPNECFRKYARAEDSYKDHSDYLRKSPRYNSCFALDVTDYAGWATELKRCGYATNPKYAAKLVRVVEDFHLQDYTALAMKMPVKDAPVNVAAVTPAVKEPVVDAPVAPAAKQEERNETIHVENITPVNEPVKADVAPPAPETIEPVATPVYGQQMQRYGLKGFYAHKGDVLLEYAIKYNLRYARLLELNDLPDAPLAADMFVYLEKKHATGMHRSHTVVAGETMASIAQTEGIQLKQLRTLNQMEQGEEPNAGTSIQLQTMAAAKPAVSGSNVNNAIVAQPTYQASISKPEPVAVVRSEAPAPAIEQPVVTKPVTNEIVAVNNNPVVEQPKPAAKEEVEEQEEPVRQQLPAVPAVKPVKPATPPAVSETPVYRPAPKPTRPAQKTFTIADEMAVGEDQPDNTKYSPRYVPPKTATPEPKVETPVAPVIETPTVPKATYTEPVNAPVPDRLAPVVTTSAVVNAPAKPIADEVAAPVTPTTNAPTAPAPQDEFSRLKAQLDKAVYAPRKPAKMEVTEETPESLHQRPVATSDAASTAIAPQVAAGTIGYHTVKNGETAFSIAKKYGMSMKELRDMNNLNFEAIKVGQKLKVKAN